MPFYFVAEQTAQPAYYALDTGYIVALGYDERAECLPRLLTQYSQSPAKLHCFGRKVIFGQFVGYRCVIGVQIEEPLPQCAELGGVTMKHYSFRLFLHEYGFSVSDTQISALMGQESEALTAVTGMADIEVYVCKYGFVVLCMNLVQK